MWVVQDLKICLLHLKIELFQIHKNQINKAGKFIMQKKTKSLLEELQNLANNRDINHIIESRASNVITSAINLCELLKRHYSSEKAELLEKKLLLAIKNKDENRFSKSLRKKNEIKKDD